MTLQDYLVREGLTFTAFATMVGTKYPSTIERYAKGQQIPGRSMMGEIVRVTRGEVMPNDFYGFHADEDKSASAASSSYSDASDMTDASAEGAS